jgi:hypothetical protein
MKGRLLYKGRTAIKDTQRTPGQTGKLVSGIQKDRKYKVSKEKNIQGKSLSEVLDCQLSGK